MMPPDIFDYSGFGQNKLPTHHSGVTACPCTIGDALLAQSEAVRLILNLRFLEWLVKEGRVNED